MTPETKKDGITAYYKKEESPLHKYKVEILYTSIKSSKSMLYESLQIHCNLYFFSIGFPVHLEYSSDYKLFAFAMSSKGQYYVTIGGIGDTDDDYYPVGVIFQDKCFVIANSIKEFLLIMAYYPFWDELVGYNYNEIKSIIRKYFLSTGFNCSQKSLLSLLKFFDFDFNLNVNILPVLLNKINNPQYITLYKL